MCTPCARHVHAMCTPCARHVHAMCTARPAARCVMLFPAGGGVVADRGTHAGRGQRPGQRPGQRHPRGSGGRRLVRRAAQAARAPAAAGLRAPPLLRPDGLRRLQVRLQPTPTRGRTATLTLTRGRTNPNPNPNQPCDLRQVRLGLGGRRQLSHCNLQPLATPCNPLQPLTAPYSRLQPLTTPYSRSTAPCPCTGNYYKYLCEASGAQPPFPFPFGTLQVRSSSSSGSSSNSSSCIVVVVVAT